MSIVQVKRHIVKSISYRFLGTLQTALIGYAMTGDWVVASSMGIVELCIKPVIYFVHERVWYKWVSYGVIPESHDVGKSIK